MNDSSFNLEESIDSFVDTLHNLMRVSGDFLREHQSLAVLIYGDEENVEIYNKAMKELQELVNRFGLTNTRLFLKPNHLYINSLLIEKFKTASQEEQIRCARNQEYPHVLRAECTRQFLDERNQGRYSHKTRYFEESLRYLWINTGGRGETNVLPNPLYSKNSLKEQLKELKHGADYILAPHLRVRAFRILGQTDEIFDESVELSVSENDTAFQLTTKYFRGDNPFLKNVALTKLSEMGEQRGYDLLKQHFNYAPERISLVLSRISSDQA